jgi:hypothetical protein
MSKLSGAVLVIAGLGLGTYCLAWSPDRVAGDPPLQHGGSETGAPPAASADLAAPAPPTAATWQASVEQAAVPPPKADTAAAPPAAARKAHRAKSVRVSNLPPRVPASPPPSSRSGPPLDGPALAREIQRHLKRVGCYDGDIDGTWSPVVRRSMKAFTDRANATLPVDHPDVVLLALVQNYPDRACARSCPAGQAFAEDRGCVPAAIIANTAGQPAPHLMPPTDMAAPPPPPPPGRMALAGPAAEDGRLKARVHPRTKRSARRPAHEDRRALARRRGGAWAGLPSWAAPTALP